MTNDGDESKGSTPSRNLEYNRVKEASIRGAGVGAITLFLKACIDFGSIAILARLLTPEDFGVVAMAGTVLNLLRIVGDWGLVMASTQRLLLSPEQLSALFWINTGIGASLTMLSVACAPLLALIFNEPRVAAVTVVMSVTVLAIGIGAQHEAIMRRKMKYGLLHTLDVASQAVGLAIGVCLAIIGMGLWSLVAYQVVARLVRTGLLWSATGWIPGRPRRGARIMDRVSYGAQFVPAQLLTHASRSIGEIVVGASVGAAALGVYRRAHGIVMVVEQLKQPLKAMMPASLSRLQHRPHEFARFLLHSLTIWSIVACGTIGYVAAEAAFVVGVLLGDQWLGAVPLIRSLVLAGVATALGSATEWILLPLAEMKSLIALRAMRTICVIVGVLVGWQWGVRGVAFGYSITVFLSVSMELVLVSRKIDLSLGHLVAPFLRAIVSSGIAAVVVLMVPENVPVVMHVVEIIIFPLAFLAVHSCLPGGWAGTRMLFRAVVGARRLLV